MVCTNCGKLISADSKYCQYCGERILFNSSDNGEYEVNYGEHSQNKKPYKYKALNTLIVTTVILIGLLLFLVIIPGTKYNTACSLMESGNSEDAIQIFSAISWYKDSKERVVSYYSSRIGAVQEGDVIKLGTYEQDGNYGNGKEDIEWIVLKREQDQVLLISKYCLAARTFNSNGACTWANCSLRNWLNNDFLSTAFTDTEQTLIIKTSLTTRHTNGNGTKRGSTVNTTDNIFLLDRDEIVEFFPENKDRRALPTEVAKSQLDQNIFTFGGFYDDDGYCAWWYRNNYDTRDTSFDYEELDGLGVKTNGGLGNFSGWSNHIDNHKYGVRPALWISIY